MIRDANSPDLIEETIEGRGSGIPGIALARQLDRGAPATSARESRSIGRVHACHLLRGVSRLHHRRPRQAFARLSPPASTDLRLLLVLSQTYVGGRFPCVFPGSVIYQAKLIVFAVVTYRAAVGPVSVTRSVPQR